MSLGISWVNLRYLILHSIISVNFLIEFCRQIFLKIWNFPVLHRNFWMPRVFGECLNCLMSHGGPVLMGMAFIASCLLPSKAGRAVNRRGVCWRRGVRH